MQQQRGRHLTCLSDCFCCSWVSSCCLLPTFHEQMDSALSSLSRNYWHWQEIEAGALVGARGALFIEYRVGCFCRGQICGLNHPQRHTSDGSHFAVVLFVTFSSCVWFMPRCLCIAAAFVHIHLFYLFCSLSFAETLLCLIPKLLFWSCCCCHYYYFYWSKKKKSRRSFYGASLGRTLNDCQLPTKPSL